MISKEYLATRKDIDCELGHVYDNVGGGSYICISKSLARGSYTFENVKSGWRLIAFGVGVYIDGKIDWDYSKGLGFASDMDQTTDYDVVLRG